MQEKAHYISVTVIIKKDGKYLICKRSEKEKVLPGKWCVPGGKVEQKDFINTPTDTSMHWIGVLENTAAMEVKEETNLDIKNIKYVSNLAFIRPNGYSTIIISMSADYAGGEVALDEDELVEHAWVTVDELSQYDMIENIPEQIIMVENRN